MNVPSSIFLFHMGDILSQIKARTDSEKDSLHVVLQQSLEIALLSWNFTTIVPYMHVD
jgi:hypothetical protein